MKRIIPLIISLIITTSIFSQNGINYKAIVKDTNGNLLTETTINIQFIIYEGAALTNNVYQENHTTTTDVNGVFIASIGEGTTTNVFNDIAWETDTHWLSVQIDSGSGLVDLGTTQFMAVPYALSSKDNPWDKNEGDIYTLSSGVGIGINNPEAQLDIRGGDWNLDAGNPGDLRIGNPSHNFRIGVATGGGGAGITRMYTNSNSLILGANDDAALTINQNQHIGIGTTNPNTKLQITNGTDASDSDGSGYMVLGSETGLNVVYDNNEIIARNNESASTFYVQQTGGSTSFGGNVSISGLVSTPSTNVSQIDAAGDKTLVTKEYTEATYAKRAKEIMIPATSFLPLNNFYRFGVYNGIAGSEDLVPIFASIILPIGSVITEISAYMYVNTSNNYDFSLLIKNLTTNLEDDLFTLSTTNGTSNQILTNTSNIQILSNQTYYIRIGPSLGSDWAGFDGVKGVKITYTE